MTTTTAKRLSKKILLWGSATLLGALSLFVAATAARQHRTFVAPYPAIAASHDPAVIARGRYLALGPAHCADCHGDPAQRGALAAGREIPLSGGLEFNLPVGKFHVPNITPDVTTGIGRYRDEELARILRHGVHVDGRAVLPFMPFANLSDRDLTAILSFIRAQAPVAHAVPPQQPNALGRVVMAWVLEPRGPSAAPSTDVPPAVTADYGRYLVHNVANCVGCHTKVDLRTGAFAGPLLGGGAVHPALADPTRKFVTPNLTPDPRWGWIASWPEDVFVARVRQGRQREHSPMPWEAISRMTEADLRAVYRYLRTVPPVAGGPDPSVENATVVSLR
ncbi:MAG TPA: c-type cytochrome [Polyangia bacterium]|nr:c-type cytochrome [Polyangia bacterium]